MILLDDVGAHGAYGLDKDDAIVVAIDLVLFDEESRLTLDDEDALCLGVLDQVTEDLGLATAFAAESDVGFDVAIDLVGNYRGVAALY